MADDADPEIGIERPEGYTDEEWEAYKAGAAAMMDFCGQWLRQMAVNLSDVEEKIETPDEDEHPETCEECGMELVYQMGEEEGQCPNCDLL